MKNLNLLTLLLFLFNSCTGQKTASNNQMTPMINGVIETNEWNNASNIPIQDKFEILLKQDEHYYYMAVKNKTALPFYVDLFLLINDSLFNIHSSSQIGERKLSGIDWNDEIPISNWGYVNDWIANTVLFDRRKFKKLREEKYEGNISLQTVIPYDGFEFQFSKKTWALNKSKFRIEMRNMVGIEDYEETIFPENSDRKNHDNWHDLKFD